MNRILCIGVVNSLYFYYKEEMEFKQEKNEFSVVMLQVVVKLLKNLKKTLEIRVLEFVAELQEFSVLHPEFSVLKKKVKKEFSVLRKEFSVKTIFLMPGKWYQKTQTRKLSCKGNDTFLYMTDASCKEILIEVAALK
jgi:hypothetical protein